MEKHSKEGSCDFAITAETLVDGDDYGNNNIYEPSTALVLQISQTQTQYSFCRYDSTLQRYE
jgi:hypothetical protein